jgi:hypothetical protein
MTAFTPALPPSILEALLGGLPSAFFVLDTDGRAMYANALAARSSGSCCPPSGTRRASRLALKTGRWSTRCTTSPWPGGSG